MVNEKIQLFKTEQLLYKQIFATFSKENGNLTRFNTLVYMNQE
jgi:hypothetical protein